MVKNLPAMQETCARYLGWENPLRRNWQLTPGLLPGEFHGQRSLVGYSPWDPQELDMTKRPTHTRWKREHLMSSKFHNSTLTFFFQISFLFPLSSSTCKHHSINCPIKHNNTETNFYFFVQLESYYFNISKTHSLIQSKSCILSVQKTIARGHLAQPFLICTKPHKFLNKQAFKKKILQSPIFNILYSRDMFIFILF